MVNNCNAPPISELLNYKNKLSDMCLIDFKSESNRCPKSFYKTLTYTYNGISIPKKDFSYNAPDFYMGVVLLGDPFIKRNS